MQRLRPLAFLAILTTACNVMAQDISPPSASMNVGLTAYPSAEAFKVSADYFFEGRYKVGVTTCRVKPIKMAFEVKWARGKSAMIFFFDKETPQGQFIYASEDKGAGRDHFIFDNNRYETGKFIRADGKEFPVKKIK